MELWLKNPHVVWLLGPNSILHSSWTHWEGKLEFKLRGAAFLSRLSHRGSVVDPFQLDPLGMILEIVQELAEITSRNASLQDELAPLVRGAGV